MADKKTPSDHPEDEAPAVDASGDAPEVEVEVVEDPTDAEPETLNAEEVSETNTDDHEATEPSAIDPMTAESTRSPGLMLFGFFSIAALSIFLLFQMGGEKKERPTDVAESTLPEGASTANTSTENTVVTPAAEAVESVASTAASIDETTADLPTDPSENLVADASDLFAADPDSTAITKDVETLVDDSARAIADTSEAAAETVTQVANDTIEAINAETSEAIDSISNAAKTQLTEAQASEQTAPAEEEIEPVDPRAAIAALQREAEARAARENEPSETAETAVTEQAETVASMTPEEATASVATTEVATDTADSQIAEDQEAASQETIAINDESIIEEAANDDTVTSATAIAENDGAETSSSDTTTGTQVSDSDDVAETTSDTAITVDTAADQDFSKFANAVSADTGKIANELESLKEALREETDTLAAAVSEGRQLTEQQSTRITELRNSLEQALLERDERANSEINQLRERLDKIQTSTTGTPAGRKAAAGLALLSLQRAVDEGTPYADELSVIERLAPEAGTLTALRASANQGTPTLASLKIQFAPAVRNALAATDGKKASGILGRFQKLISVRPATPQQGDRPAAVISRAEAKLEKDELSAAVQELSALSGGAAEAFSDWMSQAQQRIDASSAIEALNDALLSDYDQ